MPTFTDTFNRADGALGAPWVDYRGVAPLATSAAEIVSNQLVVHPNAEAALPMDGRPVSFQFTMVSYVDANPAGGNPDGYIAMLWGAWNGQEPFGMLTRNSLFTSYSRYDLATFLATGSPAVTDGSVVAVTYADDGLLTIRVNGTVEFSQNLYTNPIEHLSTRYRTDHVALMSGENDTTVTFDDVTFATDFDFNLTGSINRSRAVFYPAPG